MGDVFQQQYGGRRHDRDGHGSGHGAVEGIRHHVDEALLLLVFHGEGLDHLAFGVDDLDKALKEARSAGHPTVLDMKTKGGRWAYIEDPNGIWIELFTSPST